MNDENSTQKPAHTAGPWRAVVSKGPMRRGRKGSGGYRVFTLECEHSVRRTGDRALTPPAKMRCPVCRAALAKAEGRS